MLAGKGAYLQRMSLEDGRPLKRQAQPPAKRAAHRQPKPAAARRQHAHSRRVLQLTPAGLGVSLSLFGDRPPCDTVPSLNVRSREGLEGLAPENYACNRFSF